MHCVACTHAFTWNLGGNGVVNLLTRYFLRLGICWGGCKCGSQSEPSALEKSLVCLIYKVWEALLGVMRWSNNISLQLQTWKT